MSCILCKQNLDQITVVYDGTIRGDTANKCQIVKCLKCEHIQLIGFRDNLKQHYDMDNQSEEIITSFNLKLQDILDKELIEIHRRINMIKFEENTKLTVLDIGAGYCTFGNELSKKYPDIYVECLEPSEQRVNLGIQYNRIQNKPNLNIKTIYLDENYIKDNIERFDYVTSWHVLEHLDEKTIDKLLQNMYLVCKKGGKIIIEVPNSDDELLRIERYRRINYMIHHLSYWNKQSLSKLMTNNNIINYRIEYVQRYGFSNYLNWVYNLNQKQDKDMNDDLCNLQWLQAKKMSGSTDAITVIIEKPLV